MALFCNVAPDAVFTSQDVGSIYEVPIMLHEEGLDEKLAEQLNIWSRAPELDQWQRIVAKVKSPARAVTIGIVGKYVHLVESYKSLNEALIHGGIANDQKVRIVYIDSEKLETGVYPNEMEEVDCILVGPGFGSRGVPGMLQAIRYAREQRVPYLGICLGMQTAVIEFARNVCGLAAADSTEFAPDAPDRVIYKLRDLIGVESLGGTMRLGRYPCRTAPGSIARETYGAEEIYERHRHRYEFNDDYAKQIESAGLIIAGRSVVENLAEIIELPKTVHPFFLGTQYHPEYRSRPLEPHPIFLEYIRAL